MIPSSSVSTSYADVPFLWIFFGLTKSSLQNDSLHLVIITSFLCPQNNLAAAAKQTAKASIWHNQEVTLTKSSPSVFNFGPSREQTTLWWANRDSISARHIFIAGRLIGAVITLRVVAGVCGLEKFGNLTLQCTIFCTVSLSERHGVFPRKRVRSQMKRTSPALLTTKRGRERHHAKPSSIKYSFPSHLADRPGVRTCWRSRGLSRCVFNALWNNRGEGTGDSRGPDSPRIVGREL